MTPNFKNWFFSIALGAILAGMLALITNLTGVSFFKVVVIALLIMGVQKTKAF